MKIVKYQTAWAGSFNDLDEKVTKLVADGFQPFGSPYAFVKKQEVHYLGQAMVKYDQNEEQRSN